MNVIGHRGASVAQPENTPEAFAVADGMGADGVELDVRLADSGRGDARLVVFHDALPSDPESIDAIVGFDAVLDACGSRMLVNVEIKNDTEHLDLEASLAVVAPTLEVMRERGPSWMDRWLISSFSLATIDRCRELAPEIPTAYLVTAVDDEVIAAAVEGGHRAIHPHAVPLTGEQVERCRSAGLHVNVWTCNDADRLVELESVGVDGVCTDVPDVALAALGRDATPQPNPSWWRPAD